MSVRQKSATFDEPVNLASGYIALKVGDYRIMPQNLPLAKLLAAFPLLFVDVRLPQPVQSWDDSARWVIGHRFLYQANDADRLLFLGRLAVLPLSLLLGGGIFLWAKLLFGRAAACFALFLYSFEPNILAHAGLVTTDLGVACFLFLVVYGFYQVAHQVSLSRLLLFALAFGLALLTKFTTFPLLLLLLLLGGVVSRSPQPLDIQITGLPRRTVTGRGRKLIGFLLILLFAGVVTYGLIWAAYRFRYEGGTTPWLAYPRPWSEVLPKQPVLQTALRWAREAHLLPEPYLYGLFYLFRKTGKWPAFLLGEIREGGWWYYFLVTFLIKTPVPLLIFVVLALLLLRRRWRGDPIRVAFLLLPVLVYFGFVSASGWNIGHRHLLPVYPFLFLLASALVPWVIQQKALVRGGVAALAAWYLFSSVSIFPHYLAYFNELVGGPGNGYKYLVDSNLDWGQDLKGLKRYMEEHGIERVWLSYFGTASPDYYGITYDYLPSYVIFQAKQVYPDVFRMDKLPLLPGTIAISATNLQGVYLSPEWSPDYFERYREQTPIAKIGYSIFLYRFD